MKRFSKAAKNAAKKIYGFTQKVCVCALLATNLIMRKKQHRNGGTMHELGVVFHIMDSLEKVAAENEVKGVSKVVLELGEVSTVIESYLQNCWKWAIKKRELFADAELIVEQLPAITYCEGCGQTYPTVEYGKICPHCQSPDTWLLQGNEFNIKEIEVY